MSIWVWILNVAWGLAVIGLAIFDLIRKSKQHAEERLQLLRMINPNAESTTKAKIPEPTNFFHDAISAKYKAQQEELDGE